MVTMTPPVHPPTTPLPTPTTTTTPPTIISYQDPVWLRIHIQYKQWKRKWIVVVVTTAVVAADIVVFVVVLVAIAAVIGIFMRMEDTTLNFPSIIKSYFLE